MVIATLAALLLLFGGSGTPFTANLKATTKAVKEYVPDASRRDQALAILKEAEQTAGLNEKNLKGLANTLDELAVRRSTTSGEFVEAWKAFESQRAANADSELALRFRLKEVLTSEEWAKVYPAPAAKQ